MAQVDARGVRAARRVAERRSAEQLIFWIVVVRKWLDGADHLSGAAWHAAIDAGVGRSRGEREGRARRLFARTRYRRGEASLSPIHRNGPVRPHPISLLVSLSTTPRRGCALLDVQL